MRLVLVDLNKSVVDAWQAVFKQIDGLSIQHRSIFEAGCQAIVSPANSFGFMDGGLDLTISEQYGWHVQYRLQERIKTVHRGELLVGQAEIIPTDAPRMPYVICAPTMRVPTALGDNSPNAYLAMRAILILLKHELLPDGRPVRDVVESVAIPGLGTGVGGISPEICARQMRQAIDDIWLEGFTFPGSWLAALRRQQLMTQHDS